MYTILEQSVSEKRFSSFRTYKWSSSSTPSNTLTKTFWSIRSNVRMHVFIQYMQMKMILGTVSTFEYRCLVDAPGVLRDDLLVALLRAKLVDVPQQLLLQRLRILQEWQRRPQWSLNLYYTWKKQIAYELSEIRQTIRPVKKFSGYVKSPSAVGTKKSRISHHDPESFEWNSYVEIDYYEFLTVGRVSGHSLELQLP